MQTVVLENVTKVFRHRPALFNWMGREQRGETRALNEVSLAASAGEVLVLLGPNGSGKTTLLKLISTMLLPDTGTIRVLGADAVRHASAVRAQVGIAVASERSFFPRLTARENLDFFGALDDVSRSERGERVEWALQHTGLLDAGDVLVMKFSNGMYQRLGIARALLKRPSVLLLDEPTRSLDPSAASRLWLLLRDMRSAGMAVVVTTHHLDEAIAVADVVSILCRGTLKDSLRPTPDTSVEELRRFYFREVQSDTGVIEMQPGGVR